MQNNQYRDFLHGQESQWTKAHVQFESVYNSRHHLGVPGSHDIYTLVDTGAYSCRTVYGKKLLEDGLLYHGKKNLTNVLLSLPLSIL